MKVESLSYVLTLCNPMDCSLPGSALHGDSAGKNTGVGCHFLLQGIFPTQGLNPGLLHCRQTLYPLSYQGSLMPKFFKVFKTWACFILQMAICHCCHHEPKPKLHLLSARHEKIWEIHTSGPEISV